MATTGSAIAAVSFAVNAGAVDHLSAVSASASNASAAGKLVATTRLGASKGKFSTKFLPSFVGGVGSVSSFGKAAEVVDNAVGAPIALATLPGIGSVTATCADQAPAVAKEDPSTTIAFTNTSGVAVNFARAISGQAAVVASAPNGTVTSFAITGSNMFTVNIQKDATNLVIQGVVRQDGKNTAAANCLFYGQAVRVN